jgi:hypothetical protein
MDGVRLVGGDGLIASTALRVSIGHIPLSCMTMSGERKIYKLMGCCPLSE